MGKRPCSGNDGERLFVGVDLGGTTISAGLVNAEGTLLGIASDAVGEDHRPHAIIQRIRALVEVVLRGNSRTLEDLEALGVCTPGLMDSRSGVVQAAANLRGWREVPLVELLAEEFHWEASKVTLENDTNAALLAEAWTGAAAGIKHIVLLTIGTGIGGAIMCDGQLLRGSKGQAGEIGHSILVPDGRTFGGAGVSGIFEGYASCSAVAIRARELMPPDSSLSKLEAVECEDVFKHAAAGDSYATELVQETAKYLALGCINCCRFVDPELILFSGGMAEAGDALLTEVRRQFQKYHWNLEPVRVKLKLASAGRNAGLLGAARAAMLSQR
ncbi:unnamed protein product [Durusdinium trenchii]|uniref:Glucokinase n=1 Tax=Durusdinium trenchii TaxID=1381693 RepID=A0ABP0QN88_9DINO